MLASTSRQSLCLPSGHANKLRIPQGFRRRCWRRPPGKAFVFRLVTPTRTGFTRASGVHVGVDLPAKPLPSVWSRQQEQAFPGQWAPMLASTFRQSLCLPFGYANRNRFFRVSGRRSWRRLPGKVFAFHLVTPTSSEFPRASGADVGVDLPAKPLSSVWSRQQERDSPGLPASMLASTFRQSLCLPSGHANKNRIPQGFRRRCWRRPPGKAFAFRLVTPTRRGFAGVDLFFMLKAPM